MSDAARQTQSDVPPCEKCGGDVRLLTILPRASDHPTFRVFGMRELQLHPMGRRDER